MYDENSNTSGTAGPIAAATSGALPNSAPSTALVSQLLNVKDSRWLQVEVCREFQRGQCARTDLECKFAHPPPHVDVQQGRVTACYDSIKGRCTRENPKCKYLHPPQHIKDQLLINGRNNLAIKNLISAQLNQSNAPQAPSPMVNPLAQLLTQQQMAANLVPTMPFPYYQGGLVYSPMLQATASADPYQAAVNQQLQAMALLQLQQQQQAQQQAQAVAAHQQTAHPQTQNGLLAAAAAAQAAAQAAQAASPQFSVASATIPASALTVANSRKRAALDDVESDSAAVAAAHQQAQLLNQLALAGVPCKRPTVDKNGAIIYQTAGAGQPGAMQQMNPYLLQSLQGYVPAVSFNGQQLPPRY